MTIASIMLIAVVVFVVLYLGGLFDGPRGGTPFHDDDDDDAPGGGFRFSMLSLIAHPIDDPDTAAKIAALLGIRGGPWLGFSVSSISFGPYDVAITIVLVGEQDRPRAFPEFYPGEEAAFAATETALHRAGIVYDVPRMVGEKAAAGRYEFYVANIEDAGPYVTVQVNGAAILPGEGEP